MGNMSNKRLRITIIGAGMSGILMAYKLQKHLSDFVDFHIFEKNSDLGGTWFENRYPGCACDVPSHVYQYSFALNPDWFKFYASSQEIQQYLKTVVKHFDLGKFIQYGSTVTSATWQEDKGTWKVEVENQGIFESEILINAGGILNHLQMPNIDGLDSFLGPMLHTAAWNDSIDLKNKRVAVIGAGASSIQLLPQIQQYCSHVDVYIRTPSWISPPVALPNPDATNHVYSEGEKNQFRRSSVSYLRTRKELENNFNGMFKAFFKSSPEQSDLRKRFEERMKQLIKDESLQEKLIPPFEAGCRRINPGEGYLIALQKPNVQPIFDPIKKIYAKGVVTSDGQEHPVDVLIAATGFNTTFRPRLSILGVGDVNLQDLWEKSPTSYMGTGVSGFPNYLIFLGPNTPISNGSLIGPLEATSDYFIRLLRKFIRQQVKKFDVRLDAQNDFDKHTQAYMQDMVWTGICRSWFRNHESGKVTALWPGSSLHYIQTLAENRWEDYTWEYHGNRYNHWQQGLSWIEEPLVDSLGRAESEALHSSSMPTKHSDISFYLWESNPLPSPPSVRDERPVEDVAVEQVVETKLSELVQINVSAAIPVQSGRM